GAITNPSKLIAARPPGMALWPINTQPAFGTWVAGGGAIAAVRVSRLTGLPEGETPAFAVGCFGGTAAGAGARAAAGCICTGAGVACAGFGAAGCCGATGAA